MALPVVAVVGRPNVGKSTFVNRLAGERDAIVHDQPGVTRDRTYRPAFWRDREFLVVDTGGLVFDDDSEFLPLIRQQAELALQEATAAILVVDGQAGPTALDYEIAAWLRQHPVPVLVAVNKCESPQMGQAQAAEFWALGLGEPYPISSIHGSGTGELLDQLMTYLPAAATLPEAPEIQVAIAGRPNVGKSSLLNALIGSDRAIVSPISGTTRDAIDTVIEHNGTQYRFIDTAGIRKRSHVAYGPEMFSVHRAFKAIHRSDVVLLVLDALEEITEQDQRLAGHIADQGRACVLIVNKWDAVPEKDTYTINTYRDRLYQRLNFLEWADALFVSAHTGQRLDKIFAAVDAAVEQHRRRVSTAVVNEVIQEALRWHTPPATRQGRQGKIYYATQVATQPPTFAIFVNDAKLFKDNYRRYIEGQIRQQLGFRGTPIRLLWRSKKPREAAELAVR
ncbi:MULTISPECIES: ribosome biogenesis GTPase Der [unclassified Thermosynechococcus]|uniref:ribosome biogenesis GTPase Der n=1 Tax=unclassified Thermosynechococcus TaxID=2622553 RepID=UPI00197FE0C5|nr:MULTISPECIES: ribosome biogenesis GTPase Der [unclassified Thermosynechococcus]MDR5639586.1 ribosome biogenesis GTPase Der [Thermosynechococcus sp. PP42]MDR7921740.1 ribosome biogenesis GTPase Der [Thermosynechococcus sp. HY213]QSF50237.1 ribosome biogenesis GTPase Der [Thermosynechococcus sp. TA-1]WNC23356.1 ribosome biogenesis GTPase Der [Thermosynechococcus sp. PP22]WNC31058.1 ribosome biogenesis GTPase Der [Thermosynechococcus sp. PKX82]